jgi:muramoyltetrapeptide carboxypeptidase
LRLAGTKFWPDYQGRILLLENPMGEKMTDPLPLDVTRADMADLVNLGVFEKICGLVIGRPFGYDEEMKKKFKQMMLDQCYGTDFPILMDVDVGHTNPIVTVPLNAMVGLDLERDEWSFFGS